ncbi:hypothetical protein [Actinoplanes sp. DH11]|uniref:hypothetical protein n=1 Tax=Actinoplanes sp. DH11 TaxID=2857011 RepID=UPI001E4FB94C|nr:hypothetical protein [Actinoplanes sp. DH11]
MPTSATTRKRNWAADHLGISTEASGVLGIVVNDRGTGAYLWEGLWNFSLGCGMDYTVHVRDV